MIGPMRVALLLPLSLAALGSPPVAPACSAADVGDAVVGDCVGDAVGTIVGELVVGEEVGASVGA